MKKNRFGLLACFGVLSLFLFGCQNLSDGKTYADVTSAEAAAK